MTTKGSSAALCCYNFLNVWIHSLRVISQLMNDFYHLFTYAYGIAVRAEYHPVKRITDYEYGQRAAAQLHLFTQLPLNGTIGVDAVSDSRWQSRELIGIELAVLLLAREQ